MDQQQAPQTAEEERIRLALWALVFAAASVLATGYRVYFHNQALQIPLVKLLNDPALYPNDPFAATLPYYASSLWRVVAMGARIVPLEPLLLTLFIVERFVVIYAAGNLALALEPRSRLAMAAAMAFFAMDPVPIIGGGTILMPYFEQTSLAVGFYMMAMAAFYRGRPTAWAIWLAAGFNCNSMYGVYALTYFGVAFLFRDFRSAPLHSNPETPSRKCKVESSEGHCALRWLGALALFAVLSIPALVLSLSAFGKDSVSADLWLAASRARVPHHIFPSTWPLVKFMRFTLLMLVVGYGVALARGRADLRRHTIAWMTVGVAWVAFAAAAEWLRSPGMMMLQPARATDLWYCFGVVALMAACFGAEQTSAKSVASIALALVPFALFHPVGSLTGLALASALLALVALPRLPIWRVNGNRAALAVAILVVAVGAVDLEGRLQVERNLTAALIKTPGRSIRRVCNWARANTTKDATFLVNPNWGEFRALSERPAFVTWKDGSALLWCRPFAVPWSERMRALGYDVTTGQLPGQHANSELDGLYDAMTDSAVRRLAARHGISYWVVSAKHESRLPVVYANRYFRILALRQADVH